MYVGRVNPLHLGHEAVMRDMLDTFGVENSLIVIGSCNSPFSLRHFFSYAERRNFVEKLFPGLLIVALADFPTDPEWLRALDDLLAVRGFPVADTTFFGGCDEDLQFFSQAGRACKILNRFTGTTPKVSATEVRDSLIHGRSLDGMINPAIAEAVQSLFTLKWDQLRRM